jgi:hypothetical protein
MSEIEAIDSTGSSLQVGNIVLYSATGTKGTVIEIMSDKDGTWALIDKTNLYYKTEVLKTINRIEDKELREKEFTREEISETLEKHKEASKAEMSDVSLESGG